MYLSYQDNPTSLNGRGFKMAKLMQNVELCHKKINITKWLVTCEGQLNNGSEQEIILKDRSTSDLLLSTLSLPRRKTTITGH